MNMPVFTASSAQARQETLDDQRWCAVLHRDASTARSSSGLAPFLYGVTTTYVVCRPGCPSRAPRRQNVRFFDTLQDALRSGFRACLRCHPAGISLTEQSAQRMKATVRLIEARVAAGLSVPLDALAKAAGLSAFHLQRSFRAALGVTPAQYAREVRLQRFRSALQSKATATVTDAVYAAGFQTDGQAYAKGSQLGMTPGAFRLGGRGESIRYSIVDCPLGRMLVAATLQGVCSIAFGDGDEALRLELQARFPFADLLDDAACLQAQVNAVLLHLKEPATAMTLPLHIRATAFQQRVWTSLQSIPAGETRTYAEVARSVGAPSAARAVARVCASNPVAVAVPCHRVVGAGGRLTGYRWGLERKRTLLEIERQVVTGVTPIASGLFASCKGADTFTA